MTKNIVCCPHRYSPSLVAQLSTVESIVVLHQCLSDEMATFVICYVTSCKYKAFSLVPKPCFSFYTCPFVLYWLRLGNHYKMFSTIKYLIVWFRGAHLDANNRKTHTHTRTTNKIDMAKLDNAYKCRKIIGGRWEYIISEAWLHFYDHHDSKPKTLRSDVEFLCTANDTL